jgi:mannose-6-phosphate isomerase-like protein (cupin superfamily)
MNGPISRETAEHYVWGAGCDGWHLVRTDSVSVIEERMPAGTAEVRHRHQRARQFFYVLEGVLTIEHVGGTHTLTFGHGLELPPRVAHQVRNDSADAVRFLVVSQPPSHGDRETIPSKADGGGQS